MRPLLIAVQFLTRLPVPGGHDAVTPDDMARATAWFPLVGCLIGGATATAMWCLSHLWPWWLAVLLGLALEAWLTGALHEDAVADFFDAFGGGWQREDVLRILKDSRLGSYGALALLLAVALRAGATFELQPVALVALMASAGLGRWMCLWLMYRLPPVSGRTGLAQDVSRGVSFGQLQWGSWSLLPAAAWMAWLRPWHMGLATLGLVCFAWGFSRLLRRRLGGTTGDCLGCACYLSQLIVLLALAAQLPTGPFVLEGLP